MAQAGFAVEVREAEEILGGACRSLPLTLPGFLHDFGSAVYPMAAGSPFFRSLPLAKHGLQWLHHPAPLAHPLDDGSAVTLERNIDEAVAELGQDGPRWHSLVGELARNWDTLAPALLRPLMQVPQHPLAMAKLGVAAAQPARLLACALFRTERARALFGGLAAHSFLSLDAPFSSAIALVLGAAAHAVGWPIPRGGSGSLSAALMSVLQAHGGSVQAGLPVGSVEEFGKDALVLCDTRPMQMLELAGHRLSHAYAARLRRFRPGPGAFKIDYALSEPVPWTAAACRRAGTVHVGGTLGEITRSERSMMRGQLPDRPFVLVAQPTLVDPSRAPAGKHIAWAYCHVPFGSEEDATAQIEAQIERFAPGFRECVLARNVLSPSRLQMMDRNLEGGDISGGAMDVAQLLFRPTLRAYRTPDPAIFLCSSSTPPGGGVHGMCGYNAAQRALSSGW